MDFDRAFELVIGHEGGLSDNPADPGGLTMYGISHRAYPAEDIKGMTLARAKEIYRRDYWGPSGCDAVPDAVKFHLFDMAVNSGVSAAVKTLQKAVGEVADGVIGPRTLQAINSIDPLRLVARLTGARLELMANLKSWPVFGRGWVLRVASNLKGA